MSSLSRSAFLLLMLQVLLTVGFVSKASSNPEITNFQQTDQTLTTVTVEWDIDTSTDVPILYTMTVKDFLSTQFVCSEPHCSYTVQGLTPCTENHLHLVAMFDDTTTNSGADLQARTEFEAPKEVTHLTATDDAVSWSAPSNENCVDHYQVCYTNSATPLPQCSEITELTFSLLSFSGCDKIVVTVRAVSGDGKNGPPSAINVETPYGDPSMVQHMSASTLSQIAIKVVWDAPALNPACVDHDTYTITIGEIGENVVQRGQDSNKVRRSSNSPEFTATLTPLHSCTNYSISVVAVSTTNHSSAPATDTAATDFRAPGAIPDVVVVGGDEHITIKWGDVLSMPCLDIIEICYTDMETHGQVCLQVPDIGSGSYVISKIENCRTYSIVILGVSGIGQLGEAITAVVDTNDAVPGPVRNLQIEATTTSCITISYDEPDINSGCAEKYTVSHTDLRTSKTLQLQAPVSSDDLVTEPPLNTHFEETICDLQACGLYEIEVFASSKSNFEGESRTVRGEVKEVKPEKPRDATFVTATTDSITITWFAPDLRYCVDYYHTYFTEAASTGELAYKTSALNYDLQYLYTFTNLQKCTKYDVTMTAVSSDKGESEALVIGHYDTLC